MKISLRFNYKYNLRCCTLGKKSLLLDRVSETGVHTRPQTGAEENRVFKSF